MPHTDVAEKLKELRKSLRLTQSQFAGITSLSEDSIGKIERGVSSPSIGTLKKIAGGLNMTLAGLFESTVEEPKDDDTELHIENLARYLRSKSVEDVRLVHDMALLVLEGSRTKPDDYR